MGVKTQKKNVADAPIANKPNISKSNIINEVGSISENVVSIGAALAMGILLISPAIMAVMAMFKRSIDFTMYMYLSMVKNLVFPLACGIVFIIYFIVIFRYQSEGASISKILKANPVFVIFFVLSALILISQFYNGAQYALTGFCSASLGETFGMEICYFVFILFGATQVKTEDHKRWLLRIQIIASCILVLAAFILWHTQVESSFFSDWYPRFSSIFSNNNYYGYYLAVSVPLAGAAFVYEKRLIWKTIAGVAFVLNTVSLSLNNTMGAWVGAIFAVLFIVIAHFIIEKKVNWQTLAIIPVFALALYIPGHIEGTFESNFSTLTGDVANIMAGNEQAQEAGSQRWKIWKASMDIVNENGLLGIGFEGVKQRAYVGPPYNIRPHNEFIQYAMFHGYPVAFLYIIGCLGIFIRALRKKKDMNGATLVSLSAAFGYLVSSCFGLTVFSTGYFLFVFLGMGYVNGDPLFKPNYETAKRNRFENVSLGYITLFIVVFLIIVAGAAGLNRDKTSNADQNTNGTVTQNNAVNNPAPTLPLFNVDNISYYIEDDHAIVYTSELSGKDAENVVIPEKVEKDGVLYDVTVLDEAAFEGMNEMKNIILPDSVKIIGSNAFADCEMLTGITLPDGVEEIGDGAFFDCSGLKSIKLPSNIKEFGKEVFFECTSLENVIISDGISEIPTGTFVGCTKLSDISIPNTVNVIGSSAFEDCEMLNSINLPEGIITIEDNAFYGCSSINEIRLPYSLKTLGDGVFDACDNLKNVFVPAEKIIDYRKMFDETEYDFNVKGY